MRRDMENSPEKIGEGMVAAGISRSSTGSPLEKCATGFARAELPLISRHWQSQGTRNLVISIFSTGC
jgi:hypothetical protein